MSNHLSKWTTRGNGLCGVLYGLIAVAAGVLFLTIGFWKTLLLAVLFVAGFLVGNNTKESIRSSINGLIPEKKIETFKTNPAEETKEESED